MKFLIPISAIIIFLAACTKNKNPEIIDVSSQQYVDAFGNLLNYVGTGPSSGSTFTTQQLALFNSLDTVSLSGTTKTDTVMFLTNYPNPYYSDFGIEHEFNHNFSGNVIMKLVITDSLLTPLYKGIVLATDVTGVLELMPGITKAERMRLFITLSAQGYDNYYTRWINIEKHS